MWRFLSEQPVAPEPHRAVLLDGDRVSIQPRLMRVGERVRFLFQDVVVVAIKRRNGNVDFYWETP